MFGKFCEMNGVIGLSGLGAGAPCVYETRDDELPGSSPVGRQQQPFLTPNWRLQQHSASSPRPGFAIHCQVMENPLTCLLIVFKLKGTLGTIEIPPSACLNDFGSFSQSALAPSATTQPQTFHPVQAHALPVF